MKLAADWRRVLRHAWSVRWMIVAGVFASLDAAFEAAPSLPIPDWTRIPIAILTPVIVGIALTTRFLAQKELNDDAPTE